MAKLLKVEKTSDRFIVYSVMNKRILCVDTQTKEGFSIEPMDINELRHMMQYTDEQWQVWTESAVARMDKLFHYDDSKGW